MAADSLTTGGILNMSEAAAASLTQLGLSR